VLFIKSINMKKIVIHKEIF